MSVAQQKTPFRFTGWHMLACMVAFFGIIIAVNITMAVIASGTWTGLVVKNSYVASQEFNGNLNQAKRQNAAGLRSSMGYADGRLTFQVLDRKGAVLTPDRATIWVGRPAFEQSDRMMEASCNSEGVCTSALELQTGPWAVTIEAALPRMVYRRDARMMVGADGSARLD